MAKRSCCRVIEDSELAWTAEAAGLFDGFLFTVCPTKYAAKIIVAAAVTLCVVSKPIGLLHASKTTLVANIGKINFSRKTGTDVLCHIQRVNSTRRLSAGALIQTVPQGEPVILRLPSHVFKDELTPICTNFFGLGKLRQIADLTGCGMAHRGMCEAVRAEMLTRSIHTTPC